MKNKSKEYRSLLLYDILAASDCLWLLLPEKQRKTKKNKENKEIPNMKNKSKEYKILLLYDILATSDCLCSASPAYTTILQLRPNKKNNNNNNFNLLLTGCMEASKKYNFKNVQLLTQNVLGKKYER